MSKFYNFPFNYQAGSQAHAADASWNRGAPANEVLDGRTDTYSTAERLLVSYPNSRSLNTRYLFLVSSGFTDIEVTSLDGSETLLSRAVLPTSVGGVSLNRGGRHYNKVDLTQTSVPGVRVQVFGGTPSTRRIYNLALTNIFSILDENQQWTDIRHTIVQTGAETRTNITGNSITIPGRGNRWKWRTAYTGFFGISASPSADAVIRQFERHPNFFFLPDETNAPYRFYPATVDPAAIRLSYVGRLLTQQEIQLTVQEL